MKSWTKPTKDIVEEALGLVKSENDRHHFFSKLKNPFWLEHLVPLDYFSNPPNALRISDNKVQYPFWPELNYLINISKEMPNDVCKIVNTFPKSNNPRIYEGIIQIALNVDIESSRKLLTKILESLEINKLIIVSNYLELIQFWNDNGLIDENLKLISELIKFIPDDNDAVKRSNKKNQKDEYNTLLNPTTRIRDYYFKNILDEGVRPISKLSPLSTSKILIKTVLDMIYLKTHRLKNGDWPEQDYSELWCRKLDKPSSRSNSVYQDLVHTLTYACEQVYICETVSIEKLDNLLKKYHWRIFKRLREHLYAKFPNKQNLPWIRELILKHNDYNRWEHHYEFQLLIKSACKKFGFELLSEHERKQIFDQILEGPLKKDFLSDNRDFISDEEYLKYQKHFHYKQFLPFEPILLGSYKDYFTDISEELSVDLNDDSYHQFGTIRSGIISQKSPVSHDKLMNLDDSELLNFINEWDDEHYDKDELLNEISIEGLAGDFKKIINELIKEKSDRVKFWIENKNAIYRPIYVTSIIEAIKELIGENDFSDIDSWFDFFNWVLSKETKRKPDHPNPTDSSSDYPNWDSSKRALIDLIVKVLKKSDYLSISYRDDISKILSQAIEMSDYWLDNDEKVFLNQNDPFSEAINNTRSIVIEAWVLFGIWVRKSNSEDKVKELFKALNKRFSDSDAIPFTVPEYAMLGVQFNNIYSFDSSWAKKNKNLLFPQDNKKYWQAAFTSYIRYSRPYKVIFEILCDDFEFAINNFDLLEEINGFQTDVIRQFGNHIFTYFLWGEFELKNQSLIYKFYKVTNNDSDSWINLFSHVGYILNDNEDLKQNLTDRIKEFFEWRFSENNKNELSHFYVWLDASCIDATWLLKSYSKILDDLDIGDENISSAIEPLYMKLNDNTELVVECFMKLTSLLDKGSFIYIPVDKAKEIIRAGQNHSKSKVNEMADEARENLLKIGRFDFMEI